MRSEGSRPMRAAMKRPLFRMEVCESMAALGSEVVPEVNWMLMVSSGRSSAEGSTGFGEPARREEYEVRQE